MSEFDAPDAQISGTSSPKDVKYWTEFSLIAERFPHSVKHLLGHWPVYVRRIQMVRFLAHWELYKQVADLPGSILEMGVSRGVSLFSFYKFLEITHPADTGRRAYGIDSFEGLTDFTASDGSETAGAAMADRQHGGWSAGAVEGELFALAELFNADNILARERIKLVKGRVQQALPKLMEETPGLRFSLVHFDMDLYEPTRFALEHVWDAVVPGGLLVFDEYAVQPWEGETRAVDEFLRGRNLTCAMKKVPWSPTPGAYFVKP